MQVTELKNEGLEREFKVVVPSSDMETKINAELTKLGKNAKIPGFRPGKVPLDVLRQKYISNVVPDVVRSVLNESADSVLKDKDLRPVMQPAVEIKSFDEGQDLEYTMSFEIVPAIELTDFSKIKLEKPVAEITDENITEGIKMIANQQKTSKELDKPRAAKQGDTVIMDFVGKIDDVAFEGGTAEDFSIEIGSKGLIDTFEDQLVGLNAGDEKQVKVTFPENYGKEDLANKEAVFDVKVKEIRETVPMEIDDAFAKSLGFEDLEALKKTFREKMEGDYENASKQKAKRKLLDALEAAHKFELPQTAVKGEFNNIAHQKHPELHQHDHDHAHEEGAHDHTKDLPKDKVDEYMKEAERQVKLGLILSEVGRVNEITIDQNRVQQAIMMEAQRFPGQEQKVFDYYRQNPDAAMRLQMPILEDQVMEFILEKADVTDKTVSVDDLFKAE